MSDYWLRLFFHILLETKVWSWASYKYEPNNHQQVAQSTLQKLCCEIKTDLSLLTNTFYVHSHLIFSLGSQLRQGWVHPGIGYTFFGHLP